MFCGMTSTKPLPTSDVAIIGAGAAGMMAAIWTKRTNPDARVVLVDGASKIGAKILIAGGGRCNVTHYHVDETAYAGASRHAIRSVLRHFDVPETVAFFADLGVQLKREETGKLFPTTDKARTVLDALTGAVRDAGVALHYPWRVETINRHNDAFTIGGPQGSTATARVVIATGGRSIPKSGSDGHGYRIARHLGHTVTRVIPALVPLTLPAGHALTTLSGISVDVTLEVTGGNGKKIKAFAGSLLCTHFGLSGPVVLDISRYMVDALSADSGAGLWANWLPNQSADAIDGELRASARASVVTTIERRLPARLARVLCATAGVPAEVRGHELRRDDRIALVRVLTRFPLPVTGTRGYNYAEVSAGGVPLSEIRVNTMASRVCPGLYLCGEICDVDGRIGGFNFQWAWASGYTAGCGVATP